MDSYTICTLSLSIVSAKFIHVVAYAGSSFFKLV